MRKHAARTFLPLMLVLVLLVSLPIPVRAAQKYMEGEHADFMITLDETGGATVTETWTCYFGGDTISRYRRNYDIPDPGNMDFEVYEVLLDDVPMTMLDQPDNSRPENCVAVFREDNTTHVEMYFRAHEETRTFTITYYIQNAVQLYNDVAEFHWNLTSEHESFDIAQVTGIIFIPYGTRDMGLYFWGHGPNGENARFDAIVNDENMVDYFELYNEDIPRDRAVTVRFAMPLQLFPDCTRIHDWEGLDDILMEELATAAQAGSLGEPEETQYVEPDPYVDPYEEPYDEPYEEPYEEESFWGSIAYEIVSFVEAVLYFVLSVWHIAAILLAFLPVMALFLFHNAFESQGLNKYLPKVYAKERKAPKEAPEYYRSLPDELKPAMVYKLMSTYPYTPEGEQVQNKGSSFSATVLDLVEAGYLKLQMKETGELAYMVTSRAATANLTEYERNVIDLYTAAGADRLPKSTEDITSYMREEYSWCKTHYKEFHDQVDEGYKELDLFQECSPAPWTRDRYMKAGIKYGILVAIGMLFSGSVIKAAVLGAISGFINALVFSRIDSLRHPDYVILTQEGEDRYAMWKAYGDFLRDFTLFEEREVQDVAVWRKYLVYAVALGCSERVVEQLRVSMPQVYDQLVSDYGRPDEFVRYDDIISSVDSIDTENGYTIRSTRSDSWSSSSDGGGYSDWGGFSDSGGDTDSGSSGSDFD